MSARLTEILVGVPAIKKQKNRVCSREPCSINLNLSPASPHPKTTSPHAIPQPSAYTAYTGAALISTRASSHTSQGLNKAAAPPAGTRGPVYPGATTGRASAQCTALNGGWGSSQKSVASYRQTPVAGHVMIVSPALFQTLTRMLC